MAIRDYYNRGTLVCRACGTVTYAVKTDEDVVECANRACPSRDTRQTSQQKSSVGRETKHRHPITGE